MQTPVPPNRTLEEIQARYWRQNVTIMAVLLCLWALVGLGAGILFADSLNAWHLGGFPLGFWFAQQGSIVAFVIIVLAYAILLNRLDQKHHRERKAAGFGAGSTDSPVQNPGGAA